MSKLVSVVQQIKTEFSDAESEEVKIFIITTVILNLMNPNG
jgi:hypothetical protein